MSERTFVSASYVRRLVQGWRERDRLAKEQAHSEQFRQARMPGKQALKRKKGK